MAKRKKEVPTGVKVISVLGYLATFVLAITGGSIIATGAEKMTNLLNVLGFAGIGKTEIITTGILFLLMAALYFFISKDLWVGKNWARIALITLSAIWAIFALISLIMGDLGSIISLVIHGLVGSYMMWSKEVVSAFK